MLTKDLIDPCSTSTLNESTRFFKDVVKLSFDPDRTDHLDIFVELQQLLAKVATATAMRKNDGAATLEQVTDELEALTERLSSSLVKTSSSELERWAAEVAHEVKR